MKTHYTHHPGPTRIEYNTADLPNLVSTEAKDEIFVFFGRAGDDLDAYSLGELYSI